MDLEVAKTTIDKLLENYFCITEDYSTLILEFIGGEPFMEVELIEKICDYTLNKLIMLQHPWLPGFRISICSNGILYFTDNVQHFLQKYKNFLSLTITIDGNKELHDLCRIDN
jgi:sulfatase maturation enzyme AslB (radical SAM superfamily)